MSFLRSIVFVAATGCAMVSGLSDLAVGTSVDDAAIDASTDGSFDAPVDGTQTSDASNTFCKIELAKVPTPLFCADFDEGNLDGRNTKGPAPFPVEYATFNKATLDTSQYTSAPGAAFFDLTGGGISSTGAAKGYTYPITTKSGRLDFDIMVLEANLGAAKHAFVGLHFGTVGNIGIDFTFFVGSGTDFSIGTNPVSATQTPTTLLSKLPPKKWTHVTLEVTLGSPLSFDWMLTVNSVTDKGQLTPSGGVNGQASVMAGTWGIPPGASSKVFIDSMVFR